MEGSPHRGQEKVKKKDVNEEEEKTKKKFFVSLTVFESI